MSPIQKVVRHHRILIAFFALIVLATLATEFALNRLVSKQGSYPCHIVNCAQNGD